MAPAPTSNADTASGVPVKAIAVAHPLALEPTEIASNINYHAKFTPHFSPSKFESDQAFFATAESVRDRLIQVGAARPPSEGIQLCLIGITIGFVCFYYFFSNGTRLIFTITEPIRSKPTTSLWSISKGEH